MNKIYYLFACIFVTTIYSCTEVVSFDVGDAPPVVVVDAEITTETKAHIVKLTYTTSVFDNIAPPMVEGATVTIEDDIHIHLLQEVSPGIYETLDTVRGYEGKDYLLTINVDGEVYTAKETLKPVGNIDCAFLLEGDTSSLFVGGSYTVLMSAQEPKGLGDYYLWNYYADGVLVSDTVGEKFYGDDSFVDGTDFNGVLVVLIDTGKVNPYKEVMMLEMKSISKGYYDFLYALQLEKFRGSPFDGPPANPPTNMTNGAVGFFRATDVSRKDMCVLLDLNTFFSTCDQGCQTTAAALLGL